MPVFGRARAFSLKRDVAKRPQPQGAAGCKGRELAFLYKRPWWRFAPSQSILNLSSSLKKDT